MLVNLTPNQAEIDRFAQILIDRKDEFDKDFIETYKPQSDSQWIQETGIYQCAFPFNFEFGCFTEYVGLHIFDYEFNIFPTPNTTEEWQNYKSVYGVADSIEQIKEYYTDAINDPDNKYFIHLTPVYQDKENKNKGGGWRWHKWGPYIGTLNPQCEYLDDEEFGDDFKYVISFHIVKVP